MRRARWTGLLWIWSCGTGSVQPVETEDPQNPSTSTPPTTPVTSTGSTSTTTSTGVYGLDERPLNPTCVAPEPPVSSAAAELGRVFPGVVLTAPVWLGMAPGDTSWWYVAEQAGLVVRFANEGAVTDREVVLDIRGQVDDSTSEMGLLGVAFHPSFEDNGHVYLRYSSSGGAEDHLEHVVRFTSLDGGATLDAGSAFTILSVSQPYWNHNGGHLTFGPDGYLYVGWGDGGLAGDPGNRAQDLEEPLGKMFRIDIDGGSPYAIPETNPYASGGGLPEIYALGLRNPWRYAFDSRTGELWLGDVGQDEWEEVNRIDLGGNYGWRIKEGPDCYSPSSGCDESGLIDPVVYYLNGWAASVITGPVYRGEAFPELEGALIYTDHYAGDIYALLFDPVSGDPNPTNILPATGRIVVHFAEDPLGEVLLLDYVTGGVYRIERASPGEPSDFPSLLSETGCVDPADPSRPATGLIPYAPIHPFWSDGAEKDRWMAIPDGEQIELDADGDLLFPIGTVLIKDFELGGERVTTRLFMRHTTGDWAGYTYAWLDDGSDAELVSPSGELRWVGDQEWRVPSRAECVQCHTSAAGHALGLELQQLGHAITYPSTGRTADQVDTLDAIGMFADAVPGTFTVLPGGDDLDQPVEERARAYLHVNCASCHQPGSTGRGLLDLRYGVDLEASGLCEPPTLGDLGVEDPRLVAPGAPGRSMISVRAGRRDAYQMPPMGSEQVDVEGLAVVDRWITDLESCP